MPNILQDRKIVKYVYMNAMCAPRDWSQVRSRYLPPPPPPLLFSEESLHTGLDAAVAMSLCEEMAKLNKMLIKVPKSFTVN
jgi:hypothetical protein